MADRWMLKAITNIYAKSIRMIYWFVRLLFLLRRNNWQAVKLRGQCMRMKRQNAKRDENSQRKAPYQSIGTDAIGINQLKWDCLMRPEDGRVVVAAAPEAPGARVPVHS